jgi:hypothetical protein
MCLEQKSNPGFLFREHCFVVFCFVTEAIHFVVLSCSTALEGGEKEFEE